MQNNSQIKCPNCGTSIDVQDILSHQLEDQIKQEYQQKLTEEKKKFDSEFEKLNREKDDFEVKKKQENELFQDRFDKRIKEEKKAIEEKLKIKLAEEQTEQFQALQTELNEKSEKLLRMRKNVLRLKKLSNNRRIKK